jgi:hypothetical protein
MFICHRCDQLRDSDDGAISEEGTDNAMLCIDCANELEDEVYHTSSSPAEEYERVERMRRDMEKAMGPDHTKTGIFVYNRCAYCDDGRLPCRQGAVNRCDNPRARND